METRKRAVIDITNEPGEVVSLAAAQAEREAQHGYLGRLPDRVLREIATYLYTCMAPSIEFIPVLAPFVGDADIQANFSLMEQKYKKPSANPVAWLWREHCKTPHSEILHNRLAKDNTYNNLAFLFAKKRPTSLKYWFFEFPDAPGPETIRNLFWVLRAVIARGTVSNLFLVASLFAKTPNSEIVFDKNKIAGLLECLVRTAFCRDDSVFYWTLFSIIKLVHANDPFDLRPIIATIILRRRALFRSFLALFDHMKKEIYEFTFDVIIKGNCYLFFREHFNDLQPYVPSSFVLATFEKRWQWAVIFTPAPFLILLKASIAVPEKREDMIAQIVAHVRSPSEAVVIWNELLKSHNHEITRKVAVALLRHELFAAAAKSRVSLEDFIAIYDDGTFPMQALLDAGFVIKSLHIGTAAIHKKPKTARALFERLELNHAVATNLFWLLWQLNTDSSLTDILNTIINSNMLRGPLFEEHLHKLYNLNNNSQAALLLRALAAQNPAMEQ